jgi:hypothetical protein
VWGAALSFLPARRQGFAFWAFSSRREAHRLGLGDCPARALHDTQSLRAVGVASAPCKVVFRAEGRKFFCYRHIDELVQSYALGFRYLSQFIQQRGLKPQREIATSH